MSRVIASKRALRASLHVTGAILAVTSALGSGVPTAEARIYKEVSDTEFRNAEAVVDPLSDLSQKAALLLKEISAAFLKTRSARSKCPDFDRLTEGFGLVREYLSPGVGQPRSGAYYVGKYGISTSRNISEIKDRLEWLGNFCKNDEGSGDDAVVHLRAIESSAMALRGYVKGWLDEVRRIKVASIVASVQGPNHDSARFVYDVRGHLKPDPATHPQASQPGQMRSGQIAQ